MQKNHVLLGVVVLSLYGCSPQKSQEPAVEETIAYTNGFFAPERGDDGSTFRWMAPEGVIRLRNTHQPMLLAFKGRAPVEQLPQPPTVSLQLNGQPLDQIDKAADTVERAYRIPATQQGSGDWSELRIRTTESFVPRALDPKSADTRQLAFNLYSLSWETDQ